MTVNTTRRRPTRGQILWRCRRGMLELDLLLGHFAKKRLDSMTAEQTDAFLKLLDYPDQQLLEILMGHKSTGEDRLDAMANNIRHDAFHP